VSEKQANEQDGAATAVTALTPEAREKVRKAFADAIVTLSWLPLDVETARQRVGTAMALLRDVVAALSSPPTPDALSDSVLWECVWCRQRWRSASGCPGCKSEMARVVRVERAKPEGDVLDDAPALVPTYAVASEPEPPDGEGRAAASARCRFGSGEPDGHDSHACSEVAEAVERARTEEREAIAAWFESLAAAEQANADRWESEPWSASREEWRQHYQSAADDRRKLAAAIRARSKPAPEKPEDAR